jgi:hypothetical protein
MASLARTDGPATSKKNAPPQPRLKERESEVRRCPICPGAGGTPSIHNCPYRDCRCAPAGGYTQPSSRAYSCSARP